MKEGDLQGALRLAIQYLKGIGGAFTRTWSDRRRSKDLELIEGLD